jgi:hypothetical protein
MNRECRWCGAGPINVQKRYLFSGTSDRQTITSISDNAGAQIDVLNAFVGGGAQLGASSNVLNSFEFQNYTTISHSAHTWNVRITKSFAFGPAGETAAPATGGRRPATGPFSTGGASGGSSSTCHRYVLSVSMAIRNIISHDNPGPIIGNVTSPLFGRADQPYGAGSLGGNRVL